MKAELDRRRERIARVESKRSASGVTVHRFDDPARWKTLVSLLADLVDKAANPDERR